MAGSELVSGEEKLHWFMKLVDVSGGLGMWAYIKKSQNGHRQLSALTGLIKLAAPKFKVEV